MKEVYFYEDGKFKPAVNNPSDEALSNGTKGGGMRIPVIVKFGLAAGVIYLLIRTLNKL